MIKCCEKETMVALRKDGPQILAAMKNLTPANAGRKRGQCEISGNMEDEHIRTMARECDRQMENNMEEDDAGAASSRSKRVQAEEEDAASSRSKRVQVPWETRYKELVSYTHMHRLSYLLMLNIHYFSAAHSFLLRWHSKVHTVIPECHRITI